MNFKFLILGLVATSVLTGCFEAEVEDPAESVEGGTFSSCTDSFVEDSNALSSAITYLQSHPNLTPEARQKEFADLKVRCEQFVEKYKDATCDLSVQTSSGDPVQQQLRTSDLKERCEATLKLSLSPVSQELPEFEGTPEGRGPSTGYERDSNSDGRLHFQNVLVRQVHFGISNEGELKAFLKKPGKVLLQGKADFAANFRQELAVGKTYCLFSSPHLEFGTLRSYDALYMNEQMDSESSRSLRKISFVLEDFQTTLACGKFSASPFTVGEIQEALAKVMTIAISKL